MSETSIFNKNKTELAGQKKIQSLLPQVWGINFYV